MSRRCQRKARQQLDTEKPKLDAARRLICACDISSDDQESDTVIKNAKRNFGNAHGLRHAVQSTKNLEKKDIELLVLHQPAGENLVHQRKKSSTICAHKIGACEHGRCRVNESGKQRHEEHIADRGHNSMSLHNLGHFSAAYSISNEHSGGKGGSG